MRRESSARSRHARRELRRERGDFGIDGDARGGFETLTQSLEVRLDGFQNVLVSRQQGGVATLVAPIRGPSPAAWSRRMFVTVRTSVTA